MACSMKAFFNAANSGEQANDIHGYRSTSSPKPVPRTITAIEPTVNEAAICGSPLESILLHLESIA
jgi:hypothetical protein